PTEIVCDPRVFQAAYNRNAPVTPDEVALASALHEVVHLVSTDLDEQRPIPPDWPRITEDPLPDEELDLLTALERAGGPVAEKFFFALEDARQECQGLRAYPGARAVLADLYRAAFPSAVANSGPLSQFALGCFLIVGDYLDREVLEKRFEARAAVALDDATEPLREAAAAADPCALGAIALRLTALARARGHRPRPRPPHPAATAGDPLPEAVGGETRRRASRPGRRLGPAPLPRHPRQRVLPADPPGRPRPLRRVRPQGRRRDGPGRVDRPAAACQPGSPRLPADRPVGPAHRHFRAGRLLPIRPAGPAGSRRGGGAVGSGPA